MGDAVCDRCGGDRRVSSANATRVYETGGARTHHISTNLIIDVDEGAGTATCPSHYVMYQQTDELPLATDQRRSQLRRVRARRRRVAVDEAIHPRDLRRQHGAPPARPTSRRSSPAKTDAGRRRRVEKFLNLTVTGAVSGALYSLIACSLVLTYTASGVFNLAYGAVAFLSALIYFELTAGLGWPVGVAGSRRHRRLRTVPRMGPQPGDLPAAQRRLRRAEDHGDRRSARRPAGPRPMDRRTSRRRPRLADPQGRHGRTASPGSDRRRRSSSTSRSGSCSTPIS